MLSLKKKEGVIKTYAHSSKTSRKFIYAQNYFISSPVFSLKGEDL